MNTLAKQLTSVAVVGTVAAVLVNHSMAQEQQAAKAPNLLRSEKQEMVPHCSNCRSLIPKPDPVVEPPHRFWHGPLPVPVGYTHWLPPVEEYSSFEYATSNASSLTSGGFLQRLPGNSNFVGQAGTTGRGISAGQEESGESFLAKFGRMRLEAEELFKSNPEDAAQMAELMFRDYEFQIEARQNGYSVEVQSSRVTATKWSEWCGGLRLRKL